jgi:2-alkenal reductase
MSRLTQIGITIVVFLGILVGVGGGALAGGAAGYYVAQQQIASLVSERDAVVVETVNSALEDADLSAAEPGAVPAPTDRVDSAPAQVFGNLADTMIDAVEQVSPAVVTVISRTNQGMGSGSGVIIDADGHIITNHHVIEGASELSVLFADSSRQPATLIGSDPLSDIAVIRVSGGVPAVATIGNSNALRPGEPVLAIGSPLGNFRNSVTSGIVSALNRSVSQFEGLIQTDASINRGNSGGPLINLNGEVVGINTLVVRGDGSVFGGAQAEGLGFAVPSFIFSTVSEQLIQTGEMKYPYLGIRYTMIDSAMAIEQNLPVDNGALVAGVEPGTPAERAGLQVDDIITAVDGVSLAQDNSLRYMLTQYQPGDTVELTIRRGDEQLSVSLELGTRPNDLELFPGPQTP